MTNYTLPRQSADAVQRILSPGHIVRPTRTVRAEEVTWEIPMIPEKFIPWFAFFLTFAASLLGVPVWVFTTFATQAYVRESNTQILKYIDERHGSAINHSDMNRAAVQSSIEKNTSTLQEIKEMVKTIEARNWESYRRRPHN